MLLYSSLCHAYPAILPCHSIVMSFKQNAGNIVARSSTDILCEPFDLCASCGIKYGMYHQYVAISVFHKKAEYRYRMEDKAHKAKLQWGEKSTAPKLQQQSLEMCCCSGIPYSTCNDGICGLCLNPCSFVCSLNNYNSILADRKSKESGLCTIT